MRYRFMVYSLSVCVLIHGLLLADEGWGQSTSADTARITTLQAYAVVKGIEGRFTVAGSNTMYPLMTRLVAEFKRYYPNVQIGVEGQGSKSVAPEGTTGQGPFWEMVQNKSVYRRGDGSDDGHHVSMQVHVMASSRKLSPKELDTFRSRYGYEPLEIPIALEAVAIYVHSDNPVAGLTLEQVDAIFSDDRRRGRTSSLVTWGDVGLTGDWSKAPIHLFGRDQRSGTRSFFREQVLMNGEFKPTVKEVPGAAMLTVAVGGDPLAIGYNGIEYQMSSVRPVPLAAADGRPFVSPTAETALDGTYPLTRDLHLYINKKPDQDLSPALREFVRFINSQEGQHLVVKSGVYALPLAKIQQNLFHVSNRKVALQGQP
ncbi:MAG TPA: PstS family phosphate ABC transporter substrate-binding protein [Anaerolineales bacterium]